MESKMKFTIKDITGQKFGMAIAISPTNKRTCSGSVIWEWLCDCGEIFYRRSADFIRDGNGACPSCAKKNSIKSKTTHGYTGTKEFKSWCEIKRRCFDPNREAYKYYGGAGITMSEEFVSSFEAFLDEIGEIPKDGREYSCGRIDNSKGYERGNIRWETDNQQARNHTLRADNTSGVTGVHFYEFPSGPYWFASWRSASGKPMKKYFSVKRYGEEQAFQLACDFRKNMINSLNEILGEEGYSPNHGK